MLLDVVRGRSLCLSWRDRLRGPLRGSSRRVEMVR